MLPLPKNPRRGAALMFSVIAVMVVSIFAAVFLQLSTAVTRRLGASSDMQRALNIAEAGLAEAYTGLAVARTGNVASSDDPAFFGGGCFWVEAEATVNGMVELECTALYGTGRATLGLACEPVAISVGSLGFFTTESMRLNPDVRLDSYDSALGTYASQINTPINNKGKVGTNADMSIASGDFIYGDVVYGPTGKLDTASGAIITGGSSARPDLEVLPPIEVPEVKLGTAIKYSGGTPLVISPGTTGYAGLDIGKNSQLVLKGPLTLVVTSLILRLGAQMTFDTTDGPIELYVTESLDMSTSSVVSTTTQVTGDSLVYVSAPPGKTVSFGAKSQFYGFIYAPNATVHISAQYELYGGLVAKELQLAAQGKMHYDLAIGTTLLSQLPLLHSWRVVELPQGLGALRMDPFRLLDLDPSALRSPSESHEDQVLDVRYVSVGGATDSYFGRESDFDWSQVKELLFGARDGRAFYLPEGYAGGNDIANDPLVDLANSTLTSKQLLDALLAASPVSSEALVAACERQPTMNTSDLKSVLDANYPLRDPTLLAAILSAALDSSTLNGVLVKNSPLSTDVLGAALSRSPPLSSSDLSNLLKAQ